MDLQGSDERGDGPLEYIRTMVKEGVSVERASRICELYYAFRYENACESRVGCLGHYRVREQGSSVAESASVFLEEGSSSRPALHRGGSRHASVVGSGHGIGDGNRDRQSSLVHSTYDGFGKDSELASLPFRGQLRGPNYLRNQMTRARNKAKKYEAISKFKTENAKAAEINCEVNLLRLQRIKLQEMSRIERMENGKKKEEKEKPYDKDQDLKAILNRIVDVVEQFGQVNSLLERSKSDSSCDALVDQNVKLRAVEKEDKKKENQKKKTCFSCSANESFSGKRNEIKQMEEGNIKKKPEKKKIEKILCNCLREIDYSGLDEHLKICPATPFRGGGTAVSSNVYDFMSTGVPFTRSSAVAWVSENAGIRRLLQSAEISGNPLLVSRAKHGYDYQKVMQYMYLRKKFRIYD